MSRPPEVHDAAKNNLRLFKLYEAMLQGQDTDEYINCTGNLAAWLGDPKAYYSAARPNIVKLLIIAQQALRTAVQTDTNLKTPFNATPFLGHPMTPSYVKLLRAIEPFQDLFVENHLRTAVATLLQSVAGISLSHSDPHPPGTFTRSPPQTIDLTGSPPPTTKPPTPANIDLGSTPTKDTTDEFPSAVLSPMNTTPKHPTSAMASSPRPQMEQDAMESTNPQNACPESSRSGPVENHVLHGNPPTLSTQIATEDTSSLALSRNTKKKKKKIDLTAFVRSDLHDFRQKQTQAPSSTPEPVQIKNELETEPVSSTADAGQQKNNADATPQNLIGQPRTPDAQHHPNLNPPTQENRYPPPPSSTIFHQASQEPVPQQPPISEQGGPKEPSSSALHSSSTTPELHITTNDNPPKSLQEPPQHALTQTSKTPSVADRQLQPQNPPTPVHSRLQDKHLSLPQLVIDSFQHPIAKDVQMNSPDVQMQDSPFPPQPHIAAGTSGPQSLPALTGSGKRQSPLLTPIAPIQHPIHRHSPNLPLSRGTPHTTSELDEQRLTPASTLRPLIISDDSKLAQLFKWYEEYKASKITGVFDSGSIQPSEQQGQVKTQLPKADPECLAEDVAILDQMTKGVFGKELQIVAITKGFTHDTFIELAFEMEEPVLKPLSAWVHGSETPLRELRSTVCLSLGCYSTKELRKSLQGNKPDEVAEAIVMKAIATLPSNWPQSGGLSMNVNLNGARTNLPLAPPFIVTGDGLVDISEFVVVGKNTIQIHQRKDFTDYMFVLHAHRPTYKQLQRIVDYRKKEVEWRSWLTDITRPLDITLPSRS